MPQSIARQLIDTHPLGYGTLDRKKLEAAILGLAEAGQAAASCGDAILSANLLKDMTACLRTCLDATDVAEAAVRVLSRATAYDPAVTGRVLEAAVAVLDRCGDECARHASMHMHCRICSETCRRASAAAQEMLAGVEGRVPNVS